MSGPANRPFNVWYVPQIPGPAFEVRADTLQEAVKLLDMLARFSAFEFEQHVKPGYSDAGGIAQWDAVVGEYEDVDEDELALVEDAFGTRVP